MRGLDMSRWDALAAYQHRITDQELIFITLHYIMIAARIGDNETLTRGLQSVKAWAAEPIEQGVICETVGQDLAIALQALGRGTKSGQRHYSKAALMPYLRSAAATRNGRYFMN